jgi:phage tail-like protein
MADEYRNFKYEVEVEGFTRAGFAKVSGLKQTTEVIEYREGGENETPRKLPGQTKFENITLERGVSFDSDFIDWTNSIYNVDNANGIQGDDNFRRQIVIYLKDKAGNRVMKWTVSNAWPTETGEEDLDSMGNDVLRETITLANEGVKREKLA